LILFASTRRHSNARNIVEFHELRWDFDDVHIKGKKTWYDVRETTFERQV